MAIIMKKNRFFSFLLIAILIPVGFAGCKSTSPPAPSPDSTPSSLPPSTPPEPSPIPVSDLNLPADVSYSLQNLLRHPDITITESREDFFVAKFGAEIINVSWYIENGYSNISILTPRFNLILNLISNMRLDQELLLFSFYRGDYVPLLQLESESCLTMSDLYITAIGAGTENLIVTLPDYPDYPAFYIPVTVN